MTIVKEIDSARAALAGRDGFTMIDKYLDRATIDRYPK